MKIDVPFHGAYWVVPGRLLAGPYPGHPGSQEKTERRVEELTEVGIRGVINLMQEDGMDHAGQALIPYAEIMHRFARQRGTTIHLERHPIRDMGIPEREVMATILDRIDAMHAERRPVYMHCWGGKGRTGMVIGCYLLRHGMATYSNVLERLRQIREIAGLSYPVPETAEQRDFLHNWRG